MSGRVGRRHIRSLASPHMRSCVGRRHMRSLARCSYVGSPTRVRSNLRSVKAGKGEVRIGLSCGCHCDSFLCESGVQRPPARPSPVRASALARTREPNQWPALGA